MRRSGLAGTFATLAILAACSDDDPAPAPVAQKTANYVSIDAEKLCHVFTTDCPRKTGQTFDECVKIYEATRVPPECKDKLDALTCDSSSEVQDCWPTCSGLEAECDGPHIIECAPSGRRYTYDCDGVCATQNKTWSGKCGTSYKSQTSNLATCWCN